MANATQRNPVIIRGTVVALITAAIHVVISVFDLKLPGVLDESTLAGVADLVGGIVAAWLIRRAVTPTADPRDDQGRKLTPMRTTTAMRD